MLKFLKNERRDFATKSGVITSLEFSIFQVGFTGFLCLQSRPNLRSDRAGELAVTQEARLGDCKIVLSFENYALKNTANLVTLRDFNGTHVGRVGSFLGHR